MSGDESRESQGGDGCDGGGGGGCGGGCGSGSGGCEVGGVDIGDSLEESLCIRNFERTRGRPLLVPLAIIKVSEHSRRKKEKKKKKKKKKEVPIKLGYRNNGVTVFVP